MMMTHGEMSRACGTFENEFDTALGIGVVSSRSLLVCLGYRDRGTGTIYLQSQRAGSVPVKTTAPGTDDATMRRC